MPWYSVKSDYKKIFSGTHIFDTSFLKNNCKNICAYYQTEETLTKAFKHILSECPISLPTEKVFKRYGNGTLA